MRRGMVKTVMGVVALAALVTGGVLGSRKLDAIAMKEEAAKQAAKAAKAEEEKDADLKILAASLAKEPCDRDKAYDYATELARKGENRRAVDSANAFFGRCGEYRSLRSISVASNMRIGAWDAAATDASRVIAKDPTDYDAWYWRARAYEEKGELDKAASDYRQALVIRDDLLDVPFDLARVLERLDRPCEAIAPFETLAVHAAEMSGIENVRYQIERLYALPRCASMQSEGRATIRIPSGGSMHANVSVNGSAKVRMLVDTGADSVTISREFATRLGLDVDLMPTIRLHTAGGDRIGHIATLDSVAVQGLRLRKVEAIVSDDLHGDDALLGQSFLARFTIKIDRQAGRMELTGRK